MRIIKRKTPPAVDVKLETPNTNNTNTYNDSQHDFKLDIGLALAYPEDMKGILISEWVKDYDSLRVTDVQAPRLKKAEDVLVDVVYAGLNFVDTLYCRGKHQNNRSIVVPPFILGVECAGIVRQVPAGCTKFKVGDKVFGGGVGAFAEQMICDEQRIQKVFNGWTLEQAAAMAATAPVSYGALVRQAKLKEGETVLVHAAAGGLGIMAVQIAKALGCTVVATVGSDEKADVARRYGADHIIDYKKDQNWEKQVMEVTAGRGVDVTFDTVGLIEKSIRCSKYAARVLVLGFVGREGNMEKIATNRILLKSIKLLGYRFGEHGRQYPDDGPAVWAGLTKLLERGLIKPVIYHERFEGLDSVPNGLKAISDRKIYGKAIVRVQPALDEISLKL